MGYEFGEPVPEWSDSPKRRRSGWRKAADASWKAKKLREKRRPKLRRRVLGFVAPEPCPTCYAPMKDGECSGSFHTRERLGA